MPRAIAVRPRDPIAADIAAADEAWKREQEERNRDTPGWRAIKAAGGAVASAVAGAYLARQDWVPPKVMTGVLTAAGAVLALEGPDGWKALGLGAMSAAGAQLGFMLIDDQLIKSAEDKDKKERVASKPAPPAKKQSNAGDISADALARAYERARLRMALTSEPTN